MASLSYLQRHPRTGMFWFRRAVPKGLRERVGKREIVGSLKTRDPREARRRVLIKALEVEDLFAGLLDGTGAVKTLSGGWGEAGRQPSQENQPKTEPLFVAAQPSGPTLSEAFELYHRERRLRPQAHCEFTTAIRRFGEVAGQDLPISTISKADARAFKQAVMDMPRVLSAGERALLLPEILARHQAKDVDRVSLTTVRKMLGMVQAVLGWCVRQGYLEANPVNGLLPGDAEASRDSRLPYDADDLKTIFGSPLYRGCMSAVRRAEAGSLIVKDASYWLPLLGLHTGCRLEELGQLLVADVKVDQGIAYLDINARDGGKTLKTKGSERRVPLHAKLIAAHSSLGRGVPWPVRSRNCRPDACPIARRCTPEG